MKKTFKIILSALALLLIALSLASCGAAKDSYSSPSYEGSDELSGGVGNKSDVILEDRKIIKTVYESIETDKYDDFMSNLNTAIAEAGGYISSSSYRGESYYSEGSLRSADLVIRIPAENLEKFTGAVDKYGVVYSYNETVQDITAAYVDVESRIAVLEAEETSLLEMLKLAESISDAIAIRTRLNDVQSDLASLEAQKRTYDSQVAYSTVNMYVSEVRRAEPLKPGFFEEVSGEFSDSITEIGEGLRDFAVWFLGNVIYIVIFAGFVTGGVCLVIRFKRKKKNKKNCDEEDKNNFEA